MNERGKSNMPAFQEIRFDARGDQGRESAVATRW